MVSRGWEWYGSEVHGLRRDLLAKGSRMRIVAMWYWVRWKLEVPGGSRGLSMGSELTRKGSPA